MWKTGKEFSRKNTLPDDLGRFSFWINISTVHLDLLGNIHDFRLIAENETIEIKNRVISDPPFQLK
jgi:hypothetical protein